MTRTCSSCGRPFEAERSTAKYCGPTCRKRASRRPSEPSGPVAALPIGLVEATRTELAAAGQESSALGQAALRLAERMCGEFDTGSAVAALSKELRAVMAEALADAPKAADAMDELALRRAQRASGA